MSARGASQWFFDAWSLGYDLALVQRLAYRPVHDAVLRALPRGCSRARILDVGCGTGELALRIAGAFPRTTVVGCDFSSGMLRRAMAKSDAAHWVRGDGCRLPFAAEKVLWGVSMATYSARPERPNRRGAGLECP